MRRHCRFVSAVVVSMNQLLRPLLIMVVELGR